MDGKDLSALSAIAAANELEHHLARAAEAAGILGERLGEVCSMVAFDEDPEFTYCDNCTCEFLTGETRGWRYCPACGAEVRGRCG